MILSCPTCATRYRHEVLPPGSRARCSRCDQVFAVPAARFYSIRMPSPSAMLTGAPAASLQRLGTRSILLEDWPATAGTHVDAPLPPSGPPDGVFPSFGEGDEVIDEGRPRMQDLPMEAASEADTRTEAPAAAVPGIEIPRSPLDAPPPTEGSISIPADTGPEAAAQAEDTEGLAKPQAPRAASASLGIMLVGLVLGMAAAFALSYLLGGPIQTWIASGSVAGLAAGWGWSRWMSRRP